MSADNKERLLGKLRSGEEMSGREQFRLTFILAIPSILAQLSMCLMSYIDAAMVGQLGAAQSAAIGLVSTSTWILGSLCYANSSGFTVQIAHHCGARKFAEAGRIFRQGLRTVLIVSVFLTLLGISVSASLPHWLGGAEEICSDASAYFLIYSLFLPTFQLAVFCEIALIASGNTRVPSMTSVAMCVLDVLFNYLFIFVLDYGVAGAAIGTGLSTTCAGAFLLFYVFTRSKELRSTKPAEEQADKVTETDGRQFSKTGRYDAKSVYKHAFHISWPLWLQNIITRGAYIAATIIVAPLGTIALAANSLAITAEGFCYLPGYGMQDAATTLVGQSLGAGRKKTARRFARITIGSGAAMMAALGALMWIFATPIMGMMSQDPDVIALGARCLRIEAWAELLFGVSIVAYGCCVGAGDTLVPSAINLLSMWVIRLGLALLLIPKMGLEGYWVAMALELSIKGILFAIRVKGNSWMKSKLASETLAHSE